MLHVSTCVIVEFSWSGTRLVEKYDGPKMFSKKGQYLSENFNANG